MIVAFAVNASMIAAHVLDYHLAHASLGRRGATRVRPPGKVDAPADSGYHGCLFRNPPNAA
jgi:transposase